MEQNKSTAYFILFAGCGFMQGIEPFPSSSRIFRAFLLSAFVFLFAGQQQARADILGGHRKILQITALLGSEMMLHQSGI
ncbi:MAG: hypothetical protein RSD27_08785 [Ruthenibacterium sp.]